MKIRIDFTTGDWVQITNACGFVCQGDKVSVNLKMNSIVDESYDVPEQERECELRRDYTNVSGVVIAEE